MGKKSKGTTTTSKTVYGKTTTSNPYVTSTTNNSGTVSAFNKGTAFDDINNFVNKNMNTILDNYLNPSIDNNLSQDKLNVFIKNLNAATGKELENNVINPLSKRNMLRSSQATNLYQNLANQNSQATANYVNELISNNQDDTAKMISNLLLWYMNGYGALADNQAQSLATSQGNSTRTNTSNASGGNALNISQMMNLATQMAMLARGGA